MSKRGDILNSQNKPIGFFDSGIGGISVLKEAVKLLPQENFIYFGDSKNAPYGVKKVEEVRRLTLKAVDFLMGKDAKAVVVACNTATSAAIDDLRDKYEDIPIIGIEPALKPAIELKREGSIIVMATPVTLREEKFNKLMKNYEKSADMQPMPCPGLAEIIESGILEGDAVDNYLKDKFKPYMNDKIAAVVLGCTHYPFIKKSLSNMLHDVPIIDGSRGTANQLKRQLKKFGILNNSESRGRIDIYNSLDNNAIMDLSCKLLYDTHA